MSLHERLGDGVFDLAGTKDWRDLPKLRTANRFDAWLYRIAYRRTLGEIASRRMVGPIEESRVHRR